MKRPIKDWDLHNAKAAEKRAEYALKIYHREMKLAMRLRIQSQVRKLGVSRRLGLS